MQYKLLDHFEVHIEYCLQDYDPLFQLKHP